MIRGAPVCLAFIAVFWALGILSASLLSGPALPLRAEVSATVHALEGQWWALPASAFWARGPAGYVLGSALVLLAGIPLERHLGSLRLALSAAAGQIAGVAAAAALWTISREVLGSWAEGMSDDYFLGPSAWVVGAGSAATASMPTLWRRRTRLGVFGLLILLALYDGGFGDVVRLGAGAAGALLGPPLKGRGPRLERPVSSRHEGRVLVALLVAVSAIGPVLAGLVPHASGPLSVLRFLFTNIQPVDSQTLQDLCIDPELAKDCAAARLQLRAGAGGIFMSILPSFLLLLLAAGLRRGRRFAWAGVLLVQAGLSVPAIVTIAGVLQPAGPGTAVGEGIGTVELDSGAHPLTLVLPLLVPVVISGVLAVTGRIFPVAAPRGTYIRLAARALGLGIVLSLIYVGAGLALAGGFAPVPSPADLVLDVPDRFAPLGFIVDQPPAFFPQTTATIVLYEGVGILFWAVTGWLVLQSFLRPEHTLHSADKARAKAILTTQEGSSISWMTTWSGNSYWFPDSSDSFIAYRVIAGVALTLGPPVGPRARIPGVLEEFARHCRSRGWTPCLYSVPSDVKDAASDLGWDVVQVAQETYLPLDSLTFKGKKFQDIRTAMNRAATAGIHAEWIRYHSAPRSVQTQIQAISEEWIADRGMPEMGFTLGGLEELGDPEVRCLVAVDSRQRVHAVTSWLPVYRHGRIIGWTLDFMRRRNTGFRAAVEFLIASAAMSLRDEGFDFISLSGSPLARDPGRLGGSSVMESTTAGAGGLDRILDRLGSALEPVYGFRSLHAFKEKFRPRYEPLYMAYPDSAALPAIGNALTRAYLPGLSLGGGFQLLRRIITRQPKDPDTTERVIGKVPGRGRA